MFHHEFIVDNYTIWVRGDVSKLEAFCRHMSCPYGPICGAGLFCKAATSSSHHNCVSGDLLAEHKDLEAPSMLEYPPPSRGPLFQFPAN